MIARSRLVILCSTAAASEFPAAQGRSLAEIAEMPAATEPWAFVIDRDGRVSARFEGAFGAEELSRALAKVTNQ